MALNFSRLTFILVSASNQVSWISLLSSIATHPDELATVKIWCISGDQTPCLVALVWPSSGLSGETGLTSAWSEAVKASTTAVRFLYVDSSIVLRLSTRVREEDWQHHIRMQVGSQVGPWGGKWHLETRIHHPCWNTGKGVHPLCGQM